MSMLPLPTCAAASTRNLNMQCLQRFWRLETAVSGSCSAPCCVVLRAFGMISHVCRRAGGGQPVVWV